MQLDVREEPVPEGPLVGDGDIPSALDRLNWGALLLPGWWALFHGTWRWFWVLFAWQLVYFIGAASAYRYLSPPSAYYMAAFLILGAASWAVWFAFATRATRLFWERERRRVERESDRSVPRMPRPVEAFRKSQRTWVLAGVVIFVLGIPWTGYGVWVTNPELVTAFAARMVLDLAILAGVFVYSRQLVASPSARS